MLDRITARILRLAPRPLKVAIDGIDGAGKTTLGRELAQRVAASGRPAVRTSIDAFHRPRALRYARGPESPEGYYRDTFDYDAVERLLLDPLGPGGTRRVRLASFDREADQPVASPETLVSDDTVLLLDGVFLQRPRLRRHWHFSIFVRVASETTLDRVVVRDADTLGPPEAVRHRYNVRYLPAQRLYAEEEDPAGRADAVVDNDDPAAPILQFRG